MSLLDCEGCWELHCTCPDGRGWLGLAPARLREIRAALDVAIATRKTWQYDRPIGPEPLVDYSMAITVPVDPVDEAKAEERAQVYRRISAAFDEELAALMLKHEPKP